MVRIIQAFTGYPDGETLRRFAVGEEPTDLTVGYEALLVEKGHAVINTPLPAMAADRQKIAVNRKTDETL